jgi:hypothetical protein
MKCDTRQPFEVQSYIGTDIAQLRDDGERPPKSAKFVADLEIDPNPAGGVSYTYLLSANRERSSWILWLKGENPEAERPPFLYCRIATGRPYHRYDAKFAAEQLLMKSWQDERDVGRSAPMEICIWKPGLLTKQDIGRVIVAVFGDHRVRLTSVE